MSKSTKIHKYTISKGKLLVVFQNGSVWYPNNEEIDCMFDFHNMIDEIKAKREQLNNMMEEKSNG